MWSVRGLRFLCLVVGALLVLHGRDVSPSPAVAGANNSNPNKCVKVGDSDRKLDTEMLDAYLRANNNFTVNLFHRLYSAPLSDAIDDQVNLIFSPHSVWQAVILSYMLSAGGMESMLERSLGVENLGKLGVLKAYKQLKFYDQVVANAQRASGASSPLADKSLYQLDSANRIYFEASLAKFLNQETLELLNDEIRTIDFRSKYEEAIKDINGWISRVTRGKIDQMLSPDSVSPATIMVLANAAYFKGKWLNPFKKSDTEPATFILDNANRDMITVPTMKLTDTFLPVGVSETLRAAVVELPYASGDGNDLSMYLIVPVTTEGWNLDAVLERLNAKTLKEARDSVVRKEITLLTVPKFKIETSFDLLGPLNSLGLGAMFVPSKANFGCLSANLTGTAFSLAEHKAVIEVNEEGTEAAAATAFIAFRSGRIGPTEIKINRPFLYVLVDKDPDTVLFMGIVRNPLLG